jgi:hypothetical protein
MPTTSTSKAQIRPNPRPAVEWHKPKRKRGRKDSKDQRRNRLEWRNIDKEWRIFQQRWMKRSNKPGKKPLSILRIVQFTIRN